MHDIRIRSGSPLADWEAIFRAWHETLQTVLAHTGGRDAPYMHGEHGNSHLLASAVSRMPGMSSMREMLGHRSARGGRLDMCFLSDARMDLVEAKYDEFDLDKRWDPKRLAGALGAACGDAVTYANRHALFTTPDKAVRRIGVAYVAPYFSSLKFDERRLDALIEAVLNDTPHDIVAWSFPERARGLLYSNNERLHAGVIVVAALAPGEPPPPITIER